MALIDRPTFTALTLRTKLCAQIHRLVDERNVRPNRPMAKHRPLPASQDMATHLYLQSIGHHEEGGTEFSRKF